MRTIASILLIIITLPGTAIKGLEKPNVLWIVGENFSMDLECYGQKNVRTPNLNQLAREEVRHTKVYSNLTSLCPEPFGPHDWVVRPPAPT